MRASGPATPSLPSAPFRRVHREAASRAYVTVRTLIVKIISPLQNDVRRLRCACVLGIKRARRVVPDIRLQKSVCASVFQKIDSGFAKFRAHGNHGRTRQID
jgi:hypothetical protein